MHRWTDDQDYMFKCGYLYSCDVRWRVTIYAVLAEVVCRETVTPNGAENDDIRYVPYDMHTVLLYFTVIIYI